MAAKTRFELNDIDPDKIKKITNVFQAGGGSNKNIATVIWYLTIILLRTEFNPNAIQFPIVFDSPNNVETDIIKKKLLLQYIMENSKECQLILSSIGFSSDEFPDFKNINVIRLENPKYAVLDEDSYIKYKSLLTELCDAM